VARFVDAIDRALLTPMDVLLLLHVAEGEATVVDLADRLDRCAAEIRRATGNLVARGLLRPRADRTVPWGVVFDVTASGLDVLVGLDVPSSLAAATDGNGRRPRRRDSQHRRSGPIAVRSVKARSTSILSGSTPSVTVLGVVARIAGFRQPLRRARPVAVRGCRHAPHP